MASFLRRYDEPNQVKRARTRNVVLPRNKRLIFLLVLSSTATVYWIIFFFIKSIESGSVSEANSQFQQDADVTYTCTSRDCDGTCLVNRCICVDPSHTGKHCKDPHPHHNRNSIACFKGNDDRCMNIPKYGRLKAISQDRIEASHKCEVSWWETTQGIPVRNEQQLVAFDNFRALSKDLGYVLELGAGPYTKIRLILEHEEAARTANSITLVDPLLHVYLSNPNITTSFTSDKLCVKGQCISTKLHPVAAEAFVTKQRYDTIILVNTLEHTENAVQIMHNIWVLLKKGGILVFGEEYSTSLQLQVADPCHPIRIMKALFDEYLDLFEEALLGPRTGMDLDGITHQGVKQSVYAIVRK